MQIGDKHDQLHIISHSCHNQVEKSIQFLAFLREMLLNKIRNDKC